MLRLLERVVCRVLEVIVIGSVVVMLLALILGQLLKHG
jgi:hypothetical protein